MPYYQLQIVMYPTSNLAEDAITNSWSCEAANTAGALLFANEVVAKYVQYVNTFPNTVRQTNHVYKVFNRADVEPRVPVIQGLWNFTDPPTGDPLPPEVAHCLSFQGDATSGVQQARRRGRVYIGPIDLGRVGTDGRPNATQMATLLQWGDTLLAASDAASQWLWTVHSAVNGTDVPVTNGWVDDEFDTQRRRGRRATFRQLFT